MRTPTRLVSGQRDSDTNEAEKAAGRISAASLAWSTRRGLIMGGDPRSERVSETEANWETQE